MAEQHRDKVIHFYKAFIFTFQGDGGAPANFHFIPKSCDNNVVSMVKAIESSSAQHYMVAFYVVSRCSKGQLEVYS